MGSENNCILFHQHCICFRCKTRGTVFPRESAHQKLSMALFNFKSWCSNLSKEVVEKTHCPCQWYLKRHPDLDTTNGHITSSATKLSPSPHLAKIAGAAMSSSFYAAKDCYLKITSTAFEKWLKHHGLPIHLKTLWPIWIDTIWKQHLESSTDCFTSKDVFQFKALVSKYLVLHNADKEVDHLMIYCPQFYLRVMLSTWQDQTVFQEVNVKPPDLLQHLLTLPSSKVRRLYKWGILANGKPPCSYGFLKKKKQFKFCRAIISYAKTPFSGLFKATAIALQQILLTVWPQILGLDKTPIIWKKLHKFPGPKTWTPTS